VVHGNVSADDVVMGRKARLTQRLHTGTHSFIKTTEKDR